MEANAEYKKETVTVMMTAFGIWNVEQEIAKTKILCRIFQLVPIAAMTLFQVRHKRVWAMKLLQSDIEMEEDKRKIRGFGVWNLRSK